MPNTVQLQKIWHKYETEREHKPSSALQAVEWAVDEGLIELPVIDPYDVLAGQMAQALREERNTGNDGRQYRVNHAVRVTKGGVQFTFWAQMGYAPHDFMEKTFTQRREHIVSENLQLKTDVDAYNSLNRGKYPEIQLVLDYTDDVAEREELMRMKASVKVA